MQITELKSSHVAEIDKFKNDILAAKKQNWWMMALQRKVQNMVLEKLEKEKKAQGEAQQRQQVDLERRENEF